MTKILDGFSFLVVDDEPDIREILKDELEFIGAKISEAKCGNDAIELVKKNSFDLVLTDANMPEGNGMELLVKIRDLCPKLPLVVFITGQAPFTDIQAYGAGASAIFSKPIKIPDLVAQIQNLLLPPEKRWTRKSERLRAETKVELYFKNLGTSMSTKTIDIGQGGMFIHSVNDFPVVGSIVEFKIIFEVESFNLKEISGSGTVRWSRAKATLPLLTGFGIEFLELDDLSIFLKFLADLKSPAFIPIGK